MRSREPSTCPPLSFERWFGRGRLVTLMLLAVVMLPAKSQTLLLKDPKVDAGTVPRGVAIKKAFVVRNSGPADLHILSVRPSCGCTVAEFDKRIRPGAEGKITLTVDTKSFQGAIVKTATVVSDDPVNSPTTITIVAYVKGFVDTFPTRFFRIETKTGEPATAELTLSSDNPNFKPTGVTTPKPYLKARLIPGQAPGQWKLVLDCDADAPAGLLGGAVKVQTGISQEPELSIPLSGVVKSVGSEPTEAEEGPRSEPASAAGGDASEEKPVSVDDILKATSAEPGAQSPVSSGQTLAPGSKPFTNKDVIALVKAGLGDKIVIAKIRSMSGSDLDTSTDALIHLKKAGVSKAVIDAMLRKREGQ